MNASDYSISSSGSNKYQIQTLTASGDALDWTYFINCDCTSGNIAVKLPPSDANSVGKNIIVKKIDLSNNNVVILPYDSFNKVDGIINKNIYIYNQNDSIMLLSNASSEYSSAVDNRGGTGSSSSYLSATLSAVQNTNIAVNDHVKFNIIEKSITGGILLDTTSTYVTTSPASSVGRFALKANSVYRLYANMTSVVTTGYTSLAWFDVTTSIPVQIGNQNRIDTFTHSSGINSNGVIETVFSPSVDSIVELRIKTNVSTVALGDIGVGINLPYAVIEEISRQATVINTVDYIHAYQSTPQTISATGNTLAIDTKVEGNVTFDNANKRFYLLANRSYELHAEIAYGTATCTWQWYNVTTSSWINVASVHPNGVSTAVTITTTYTPASNCYVDIRVKYMYSGGNIGSIDATRSILSTITIKQIGTSAFTGTSSTTVNGSYFDLGDTRVQWGEIASGSANTTIVTLPAPFANSSYKVTANVNIGGASSAVFGVSIYSRSTVSFGANRAYHNGTSQSYAAEGFSWMAIGLKP